jgi:hypothetical protein
MPADRLRLAAGWAAVALSSAALCFWAFWGSAEAFHEGWYHRSLSNNLALTLGQYLAPALLLLVPIMVALQWRLAALPVFLALAIVAALFFHRGAGVVLIAIPLAVLGILYALGRPEPRRWAWRAVLILPLITAILTGTVPGYRAITRLDDGNYGARLVVGNGVRLVWAPAGPGWGEHYASWDQATQACANLTPDGRSLSPTSVRIWRLPTVDEAVRSMVRGGRNAGGVWDPAAHQATYRIWPEKETPLWRRYSQIIYWWTSSEDRPDSRYRIAYNGYVASFGKRGWGDYWSYRCVCSPEQFTGTIAGAAQ